MSHIEHRAFLASLGWNEFFEKSWNELGQNNLVPARVIGQEKGHYRAQFSAEHQAWASITGRFRHEGVTSIRFPAVGDWVACSLGKDGENAQIHHVLERKSAIHRKRAGTEQVAQLIATNVDFMFIATSLNDDFNMRRIDRYLTLGWESGATPILLLTKSDLSNKKEEILKSLKKEFEKVQIFFVTNQDPSSMEQVKPFFRSGKTAVLLGSSGVGKSTFINYLVGKDTQKVQDIDTDSKGRHTTTSRALLVTRWGGLVIDTPGMRELSLLDQDEGLQKNFSDIEATMLNCRFTDCQHDSEPGCAIHEGLKDGHITHDRWQSYLKQRQEIGRSPKKQKDGNQKFVGRQDRKKR